MTDLHDAALRAGVFHVIETEAKKAKAEAKEQVAAGLLVGDGVSGRVGDDILCKLSWSKGAKKIVVVDERALLAWVKEHHPTEVVESVNPAYVKSLKAVGGIVIDADGVPVEGMEEQVGNPSLGLRTEKGALELVTELLAAGRVSLGRIKELPAADGDGYIEGEVVEG